MPRTPWLPTAALLCSALVQAGDGQQISPDEFRRLIAAPLGTARYCEYLGTQNGQARLRMMQLSSLPGQQWQAEDYRVEAAALPADYLQGLRVGVQGLPQRGE